MANKPKATLRLQLREDLFAYELECIINVINDTYTSLRWLELADKHTGIEPYGDSEFDVDEFLKVGKVEIGTPDILELYGLFDTLIETLTYLGGIGGVLGMGKKMVDWGLDSYNKILDARLKKIELAHKEDPLRQELEMIKEREDARKSQLVNEKLKLEIAMLRSGAESKETIIEKTNRLNQEGKASEAVLDYKTKTQRRLSEKSAYDITDGAVEGWDLIPDKEEDI